MSGVKHVSKVMSVNDLVCPDCMNADTIPISIAVQNLFSSKPGAVPGYTKLLAGNNGAFSCISSEPCSPKKK